MHVLWVLTLGLTGRVHEVAKRSENTRHAGSHKGSTSSPCAPDVDRPRMQKHRGSPKHRPAQQRESPPSTTSADSNWQKAAGTGLKRLQQRGLTLLDLRNLPGRGQDQVAGRTGASPAQLHRNGSASDRRAQQESRTPARPPIGLQLVWQRAAMVECNNSRQGT